MWVLSLKKANKEQSRISEKIIHSLLLTKNCQRRNFKEEIL